MACQHERKTSIPENTLAAARAAVSNEMKKLDTISASAAAQALAKGDMTVTIAELGCFGNVKPHAIPEFEVIGSLKQELCQDLHQQFDDLEWDQRQQLYVWLFADCERQKTAYTTSSYLSFIRNTVCENVQMLHIDIAEVYSTDTG